MPTNSSNMNLPIPSVSTDQGPAYATNLNTSLTLIDQHNHSTGQGVPINTNGLNINEDLSFQGNDAINLRTTRFQTQTVLPSSGVDRRALTTLGDELYYIDGQGRNIRISSSGQILASSASGLEGTSLVLRNAASSTITVNPPSNVTSYSWTLPSTLPSTSRFVSIDQTGNWSFNRQSINFVRSQSCGTFRSAGSTAQMVSGNVVGIPNNLNVTISTDGHPVFLSLQSDNAAFVGVGIGQVGSSAAGISMDNSGTADTLYMQLLRNATVIGSYQMGYEPNLNLVFSPTWMHMDIPPASSAWTYSIRAGVNASQTVWTFQNLVLQAYEIT